MTNGWEIFVLLFMVLTTIVLIFVGPIFTIWSLNILFQTEIPMNFKSWAAVVWIHTVLHGIRLSFKRNDQNQQTNQ